MTELEIEEFNDSLARCMRNERFIERFYEIFLGSSEEVREKFKNTDMKKQRRVLKSSLLMMMMVADSKPEGMVHLDRIATIHSKYEHDIPDYMYDIWLYCLLQAVKEHDDHFTPEVEQVWRKMMRQGVDYMKAHYDTPKKDPSGASRDDSGPADS